jgi:hypothetical protein
MRRLRQGEIYQPGLTHQARRVQDDESAVSVQHVSFPSRCLVNSELLPEPLQPSQRVSSRQQRHEIPIPHKL